MVQLRSQLVYVITLAVAVKTYKLILENKFLSFTPLILVNMYILTYFWKLYFPKCNVL